MVLMVLMVLMVNVVRLMTMAPLDLEMRSVLRIESKMFENLLEL
jgi:hypothetical protein